MSSHTVGAPVTEKVGNLSGPDVTARFGMEATDLGIFARTPSGRLLAVFGDTFDGPGVGRPAAEPHRCAPRPGFFGRLFGAKAEPDWRSPVGLFSESTDLAAGLEWSGAAGPGDDDYAGQLLDYTHGVGCSTVLPSDVVTLGDTMYLHVMVNQGLGTVLRTEIHRSTDDGRTWHPTGAEIAARDQGGYRQLWTWEAGPDGYLYVLSTGFQRDKGVIAARLPVETFTTIVDDPSRAPELASHPEWEYLTYERGQAGDDSAAGGWRWGTGEPTMCLPGRMGEMYLRRCEDFWTLTFFNAEKYRIDCLTFADFTRDLTDPAAATWTTLLPGCAWGDESGGPADSSAGQARVAQLYCGCPIPGSTPEAWHFVVSQWNTADSAAGPAGWPYRSMQFVSAIPRPPA